MKKVLFLLIILILTIDLFAEDFPVKKEDNNTVRNFLFYKKKFRRKVFSANAFYLEAAGLAYKWSINYDRVLSSTDGSLLTARLGYGMYKDDQNKSISKIPLTVNALFGRKHFLELGLGGVFANTVQNKFVPAADFGYRYQNPKGSIVVRVMITATYESVYSTMSGKELYRTLIPYGGISLGYNF